MRRAFFDLHELNDIAAYEGLGFDNSEGHDLAAEGVSDEGADAYVFFHHQDAEVGRRVVEALRSHGLEPAWDGSGGSAITLEDLRWYPLPGTG